MQNPLPLAVQCLTVISGMQNKYLKYGISLLFWLVIWQVAAMLVAKEVLLPTLLSTLKALVSFGATAEFWHSAAISLLRICSGFALGAVLGVIGAVLSAKIKLFDLLFSPLLKTVRAAPVASFIILAFVWLKVGIVPTFISFLMVLPVVWTNVRQGIDNVDTNLLEMAKVFRIPITKQLINIHIPSVMPPFISSCVTGLGFAWKSGVAAEIICRPPEALGSLLYNAKINLETPRVMALTIVIILISAAFESAVKALARRWENGKA